MSSKIVLFLVASFLSQSLFAQPEGKPELKDWKEIEKKASKGDPEAQIKMGSICQGFLEKDEFRSFRKALEWYEKVQNADPKFQENLNKNLFALHYSGGYGVEKKAEKAKTFFEKIRNQTLRFADKPDLDFSKFYEYAESADPALRLNYARLLFEHGIDANEAIRVAETLAPNSPDAAYLRDKWILHRKRYRSYGDLNVQEVSIFPMMQKYAEMGSSIARLEWVAEAEKTKAANYKLSAEQVGKILNVQEKNPEMDLKRLFFLQKYQKGTAKISTLRSMFPYEKTLSAEQTAFAKTAFSELMEFDKQIQSLEGFCSFLRKKSDFDNFGLDLEGYRQHFYGRVRDLISFQQILKKTEVVAFVGTELAQTYQTELQNKTLKTLSAAKTDTMKLVKFRVASRNNDWLKSFKNYENDLTSYLNNLGIGQNLAFYEGLIGYSEKNYSLEQAKQAVEMLVESNLVNRQKITGVIKRKAIADLLGENPFWEDIEKHETTLLQTAWLQPEGKNQYFAYTSDTQNAFSGYVTVGDTPYFYQVSRKRHAQDYELSIKYVKNEASNLAFYSKLRTSFSPENQAFMVDIWAAEWKDYRWTIIEKEFLRVRYSESESLIGTELVGNTLKEKMQNPNNWAETVLKAKENADFFTEKNAIRSAVRYWIASFSQSFAK